MRFKLFGNIFVWIVSLLITFQASIPVFLFKAVGAAEGVYL